MIKKYKILYTLCMAIVLLTGCQENKGYTLQEEKLEQLGIRDIEVEKDNIIIVTKEGQIMAIDHAVVEEDGIWKGDRDSDLLKGIPENIKQIQYVNSLQYLCLTEDGQVWDVTSNGAEKIIAKIKYITNYDNTYFAIDEEDTLWGWGVNRDGSMGIEESGIIEEPIAIMKDVRDVKTTQTGTIVLKNNGDVYVTGNFMALVVGGSKANAGTSMLKEFKKVDNMKNVIDIEVGGLQFFMLKKDGELWGFGNTEKGQLGIRSKEDEFYKVVKVADDVQKVSAGDNTVMILKKDDTLWGSGVNHYSAFERDERSYALANSEEEIFYEFTPIMDEVNYMEVGDNSSIIFKNDNTVILKQKKSNELILKRASDKSEYVYEINEYINTLPYGIYRLETMGFKDSIQLSKGEDTIEPEEGYLFAEAVMTVMNTSNEAIQVMDDGMLLDSIWGAYFEVYTLKDIETPKNMLDKMLIYQQIEVENTYEGSAFEGNLRVTLECQDGKAFEEIDKQKGMQLAPGEYRKLHFYVPIPQKVKNNIGVIKFRVGNAHYDYSYEEAFKPR